MGFEYVEYDDPAHEADMRQLRREQLEADISPEEADAECGIDTKTVNWSDCND